MNCRTAPPPTATDTCGARWPRPRRRCTRSIGASPGPPAACGWGHGAAGPGRRHRTRAPPWRTMAARPCARTSCPPARPEIRPPPATPATPDHWCARAGPRCWAPSTPPAGTHRPVLRPARRARSRSRPRFPVREARCPCAGHRPPRVPDGRDRPPDRRAGHAAPHSPEPPAWAPPTSSQAA